MNKFQILNSRNTHFSDESPKKGGPSLGQLWGVLLSEITQYGTEWSFGVALNESHLTTVIIPESHAHFEQLKKYSKNFIGSIIIIEAGFTVRREFRTLPESSIIFPVITDGQYTEWCDGHRDRFEVHDQSYHGPKWPAHVNFWPNYGVNDELKRVLRIWRKTSTILRTQKVEKISSKIEKYLQIAIAKNQKLQEENLKDEDCQMDCSENESGGEDEEMVVYLPASPVRIQNSSDESPPVIQKKKRRLPESDESEDEDSTPKMRNPKRCRRTLSFINDEAEGSNDDDDDDYDDVLNQSDIDFIDDSELDNDVEYLTLISQIRK